MAGLRFIFLLCIFGDLETCSQALKVRILESSPQFASAGSNVTLSCQLLNTSLTIILTHNIAWVKESRVRGLTNETLTISKQQTLLVDYPRSRHYGISFLKDLAKNTVTSVLLIKNVEDADDGRYVCRVTNQETSAVEARGVIDVIVPEAEVAEKVTLEIDEMSTRPVTKLTAGDHIIRCSSEGSSIAGKLDVSLDSQTLRLSSSNSSLMARASETAGAPRYRKYAEGTLNVTEEDNGQQMSCQVPGSEVNDSTTLNVVAKPSVNCTDVTVNRRETHVRLMCVVTHVDVVVEDFMWQVNRSGMVYITEGLARNKTLTIQLDCGLEEQILMTRMDETQTRVSLTLEVVRWDGNRIWFQVTAITDVGNVSQHAFLLLVDDDVDEEEDSDDDEARNGDDANGTPCSRPMSTRVMTHALLLLVLVLAVVCLQD